MSTTEPRHSTMLRMMTSSTNPRLSEAIADFEESFGPGYVWMVSMPARLCIVADHTDYWQIFTPELMTFASAEQRMWAIIKPQENSQVRLVSRHPSFGDREFDISEGIPDRIEGMDWSAWLDSRGELESDWSNYVLGSIRHTQFHHSPTPLLGFDMLVDSTIAAASGASSSSALAMCAMMAFRLANGMRTDAEDMAGCTADAEWYVGTRGGMQDHATMAFAEPGNALRLTFRPFSATTLPLTLPDAVFATIFTHSSDKGAAALDAFNELAFVARELLPRMLAGEGWSMTGAPPNDWMEVADRLPVEMSVDDIQERWSDEFDEMQSRYPLLLNSTERSMVIADRFRFGMKEFERSRELQSSIESGSLTPESLAGIFDAAWDDAGVLYGIRTPEMDRIAATVRDVDGVLGLKVMGAGFGGNLLAVVREDAVDSLMDSAPSESVTVCNLGGGMDVLDVEQLSPQYLEPEGGLAVILLCGGEGSRMLAEGVATHKALLDVGGVPSTRFVLESLFDSGLDFTQVLVVVPPKHVSDYELALEGLPVDIITQERPLGTGNAVLCAIDDLDSTVQNVWVTFGSQPLIRNPTVRISLAHHISQALDFTLPTTIRENPYAPLMRDDDGVVIGSVETHLDGNLVPEFGETNVGGYWASRVALESVLRGLHADLYDSQTERYRTTSGELGYPNEMVRGCLTASRGVDGIVCADPEEVVGIKTPEHLQTINSELDRRSGWN